MITIKNTDTDKIFCGCYFCLEKFKFIDIIEFLKRDGVAICPKCGIDSVIGSDKDDISYDQLQILNQKMFGE